MSLIEMKKSNSKKRDKRGKRGKRDKRDKRDKRSKRDKRDKRGKRGKKSYSNIFSLLISFFCSLIIMIFVFFFFFSIDKNNSISMLPLIDKNEVLLSKKIVKHRDIKRFDVVLFRNGKQKEFLRVIGLPGEEIKYYNDNLYVNNEVIDEKFIISEINKMNSSEKLYTSNENYSDMLIYHVPKGSYFLLGDNRPNSTDSRHFGFIDSENIIGKVVIKMRPFSTDQTFY